MDPQSQFCPNEGCTARGQVGPGNIRVHSWGEHRYRCTACDRTFAATTGTPCYRLQTAVETVTLVVTLLAHGCPLPAIVTAFGVDERTVATWQAKAGRTASKSTPTWGCRGSLTWATGKPTRCG